MDRRDIKESLFALSLVTVGNLITGFVLGYSSDKLSILPALILLIPASIGLRGNIYASLGSRLSSYLHTGRIGPSLEPIPEYTENLASSTFLLMLFSIFSSLLAAFAAHLMGLDFFMGEKISTVNLALDLTTISVLAGVLSAFLMIPATFFLAIGSFRYGWNPDNITAPFITLLGDVVTLPILFLSAQIVFVSSFEVKIFIFSILIITTAFLGFLSFYGSLSRDAKLKKGKIARKIVRESFWVLIICITLDLLAGSVIGSRIERFVVIAGLLTVIPSFLEDGGAIGGILSSRFASLLHLGVLEPRLKPSKEILRVFAIFHLIGLFVFTLIGISAQALNLTAGISTVSTAEIVAVTVVAGQILLLPLNLMAYYFSILSFRKGLDPDNIGIPLITSIMDLIGSACFILVLIAFSVI
ncbi:MAG: magnesium transporter [Archaeoglobus sp.]|nr:magnesium transporter [Archaeoglobus sp.]